MCPVVSILSYLSFQKQTVSQEPEGPSAPSIISLTELPVAVSTERLSTELGFLIYFWKGLEEHNTNLECFQLHGNFDLTVVVLGLGGLLGH